MVTNETFVTAGNSYPVEIHAGRAMLRVTHPLTQQSVLMLDTRQFRQYLVDLAPMQVYRA